MSVCRWTRKLAYKLEDTERMEEELEPGLGCRRLDRLAYNWVCIGQELQAQLEFELGHM